MVRVARRGVLGGILAAVLTLGGVAGFGGIANAAPQSLPGQGRVPVLHARLAASTPLEASIFRVSPGSVPWSIASGQVLLRSDGTVQVEVARLIDPQLGYNPVPYVAASVYCGGTRAATTATVPFSHEGNAHLLATVALPSKCSDPAVLLNPAKTAGMTLQAYIATSTGAGG